MSTEESAAQFNYEEYLSVTEACDQDYNFFHDRWVPGTCSWILKHKVFQDWLDDMHDKPRVLWIHGTAGCGKSVLSSFLVEHITQLDYPCQYFFVRFADVKKKSLSLILRSLASQLAHALPAYAQRLHQLQAATTDLRIADARTLWQLLFRQSLFKLDIPYPIYWIIDGIDEAENPDAFIKLLQDLHLTSVPLRVAIISRKTHGLSSAFLRLGRQIHSESVFIEGNRDDFQAYITQEMDIESEDSYGAVIAQKLLQRARGNFLWVHLAVQKINSCYTKPAVEQALDDLPLRMEEFYDRMARSVRLQNNSFDRKLGEDILGWATCAQRLLSIAELSDALKNSELLEIQRSIDTLCGGFVVIDKDSKVTMIHETAREYLTQHVHDNDRLFIDQIATNDALFKSCISRLVEPTLRSQIARRSPPALLEYAATSWFIHLTRGSNTPPSILKTVVSFLKSPHILTWIHVIAQSGRLSTLVIASRHLANFVSKLRNISEEPQQAQVANLEIIEHWATDLVKIVGKFGKNLRQNPESIYKLIPPFCPEDSAIYSEFGRKESKGLKVTSPSQSNWDDCLGRFSLDAGAIASEVLTTGNRILILTNTRNSGCIYVYNSATLEEQRRIVHSERILSMQASKMGDRVLSYGYKTTTVWDLANGNPILKAKNPKKLPRPQTLRFIDDDKKVIVGSEDRGIRCLSLEEESSEWKELTKIHEERLEGYVLNFPTCSALSPDGHMIAYGYRNYPLTVWLVDSPMRVGQCFVKLDESDKTTHSNTFGEVFALDWHPVTGEVFGMNLVGLFFKWNPHEEESNASVLTLARTFAISRDGSLASTGDALGTIKIYATADFALLYQLSSQDPISRLAFSQDSRQLYDTRGTYGSAWEPNTLVTLSEAAEYTGRDSDTISDTDGLTNLTNESTGTEHYFARVDNVIAVAGQSAFPLYCYGTEGGVVVLSEVGRGKICELERLPRYMSLEQIAWSEDGGFVAIADLSGKISVKRVSKRVENRNMWHVTHEFHRVVPPQQGHVRQLLFHPTGRRLFAYTASTVYALDLASEDVQKSQLPTQRPDVKWICHPMVPHHLLGFASTELYVLSWDGLHEVAAYPFQQAPGPTTSSRRSSSEHSEQPVSGQSTVRRVIFGMDSPEIIIAISSPSEAGAPVNSYLILSVATIQIPFGGESTNDVSRPLSYTLIPRDMAARIREPLAFLSSRDLVFLDYDRWICSWRLPSRAVTGFTGSASKASITKADIRIEKHYFLPSDWVAGSEASLCAIIPDGTLLCPRNGDVVTVQCSRLCR
jgi:WD40 repeat protein